MDYANRLEYCTMTMISRHRYVWEQNQSHQLALTWFLIKKFSFSFSRWFGVSVLVKILFWGFLVGWLEARPRKTLEWWYSLEIWSWCPWPFVGEIDLPPFCHFNWAMNKNKTNHKRFLQLSEVLNSFPNPPFIYMAGCEISPKEHLRVPWSWKKWGKSGAFRDVGKVIMMPSYYHGDLRCTVDFTLNFGQHVSPLSLLEFDLKFLRWFEIINIFKKSWTYSSS